MKKLLMILSLFLLTSNVYAKEKQEEIPSAPIKKEVSLVRCTSSSNIWFNIDGKYERIALIGYDKEDGSFNRDIDKYICDKLSNSKIEIEYEEAITEPDNYNRTLLWVYTDGKLLQNDLISKGYGQVNYIQGEYKYLTDLCDTQKIAISKSLGIWNYPDIEEVYCKSGISVGEEIKEEIEVVEEENDYDKNKLYLMLLLDSGIVLLLLLSRKKD